MRNYVFANVFTIFKMSLLTFGFILSTNSEATTRSFRYSCNLVIAGGSTAALGAALAASEEISLLKLDKKVCLIEPTSSVGGQLTAGGTPAVDFAFHGKTSSNKKVNPAAYSRKFQNNSRVFASWMKKTGKTESDQFTMPDSGSEPCWVSVRCLHPENLQKKIDDSLKKYTNSGVLKIFKNSVLKNITVKNRKINSVQIIQRQRTRNKYSSPMDERLSQNLEDWYSKKSSRYFKKSIITIRNPKPTDPLETVIEATEWGEVLVLSKASYVQGRELNENNPHVTQNMCGQAITYPIAIEIIDRKTKLPNWLLKDKSIKNASYTFSLNDVSGDKFSWDDVWTYRRLVLGKQSKKLNRFDIPFASSGDISMQNWTAGNDYLNEFIFLEPKAASSQVSDWKGGVNIDLLDKSERQSLSWFLYLKNKAPSEFKNKMTLSSIFGSPTGLSKMPYMRGSRRSVAVDGFTLKYGEHLSKGFKFTDSVAIGVYSADIHVLKDPRCKKLPSHINDIKNGNAYPPPFYIPLRAHTNKDIENLLVAGKSMSQTYAANSATRLHPIEFSSGTAAGVTAAFMLTKKISVPDILENKKHVKQIQLRLSEKENDGLPRHTPIEWTKPIVTAKKSK